MKTALVTGGAGFIGSHLVRSLVEQNVTVRVVDNLSSGHPGNLDGVMNKIDFVEADVRSPAACRHACRDIDTVFHLAALVSVPHSVQDPISSDSINTGGTLNMLVGARDRGVKRFVFSSSAAVYGNTSILPTHESVLPDPLSPYGVQKLASEHYARNFYTLFGLETICLRYFNVYGPRQDPNSPYAAVIPRFLCCLMTGNSPMLYGDGEQTRDFCYVQDVVAANLRAAAAIHPGAPGKVFNVAGGKPVSLNQVLGKMQEVLGRSIAPCHEPQRDGDIRHSSADITLAREILGFNPSFDIKLGMRLTIDYFSSALTP